jgi:hypothetical protein
MSDGLLSDFVVRPLFLSRTLFLSARTIRQRLLARDPTLGPITERPGALSIPLRGPILDGARRVRGERSDWSGP